ncbi:hypothetical protein ACLKA7_007785 [Drosophila subpalustris]
MIPAMVLDAVGVALPKAMAKGPTKFVLEADGKRFQIRISRAGIVTAFLHPPNRNKVRPYATTGSSFVYASFNKNNNNSSATRRQQRIVSVCVQLGGKQESRQRQNEQCGHAPPASTHLVCSCASNTAPRSATSSNTPGVHVCQQQQSQHSAAQRDMQQHTWLPSSKVAAGKLAGGLLRLFLGSAYGVVQQVIERESARSARAQDRSHRPDLVPRRRFGNGILVSSAFLSRALTGDQATGIESFLFVLPGSLLDSHLGRRALGGGRMLVPAGLTWHSGDGPMTGYWSVPCPRLEPISGGRPGYTWSGFPDRISGRRDGRARSLAVNAIKLDRGVENVETGVGVFGASGNPRDQPNIGSSTEAKPPRVVAEQMRKWGMRYVGQADPLEFVELLEERAITYGIALDRMPRAFKSGFLEFFLPPQYFERLVDQIRSRRHREGEGFKDYLIEIRALMHHAGYTTTRDCTGCTRMLPQNTNYTYVVKTLRP